MELGAYFKSIVDQDPAPVVVCGLDHIILYMNPAAVARYEGRGGESLVGKSIFDCHGLRTREVMKKIVAWFEESPENNSVYEGPGTNENKDVYMVALRDESGQLIGYYEKHEYHDVETRSKFWPVIEEAAQETAKKPVFYPGCKVRGAYPKESAALLTYLQEHYDVEATGCCRRCFDVPGENAQIFYICNNCHEILSESAASDDLAGVWELIDADPSFKFPDYGGKRITLSDCWIATGNHKTQDAVRSLLRKMNLEIVEMERNRDESRRCGTNILVPSSANNLKLAPKRWGELKDAEVPLLDEDEWEAYYKAEFAGVTTEEVACYCKFCADGIRLAGKTPRHMLELLFPQQ